MTDRADVCLLLEGTYPYVRGGVAAWVHELIRGLPELRFALAFIGDRPENHGPRRYELPDNVTELAHLYIMDGHQPPRPRRHAGDAGAFAAVERLHRWFHAPGEGGGCPMRGLLARLLGKRQGLSHADFLFAERAWAFIQASYRRYATDPSFVDYFWTLRGIHGPVFRLAEQIGQVPEARAYHALSTGYAGLAGSLLHWRRQRPLLLTEHGIYTKERKIDLAQADWIQDSEDVFGAGLDGDLSYLRRLWIRFFEGLGRIAYDAADPILSITARNRARQIEDGADPARTRVIHNGVDLERFLPLRDRRPAGVPQVVGFVGRIVPIKDVKTFIRAMRTVCTEAPEVEVWIAGNEDEDPQYAAECHDLVAGLGLRERIRFLGFRPVEEVLPRLGVMVLSSISEGLPLAVLEAFAAGVPAVVTDVGACRDLIEGDGPEDHALGPAGAVVQIADPDALAHEILALLGDPGRWQAAQAAACERVVRHYDQRMVLQQYRELYREAVARADALPPAREA